MKNPIPWGGITLLGPSTSRGVSSFLVSAVSGNLPATVVIPVSTRSACGRYCLRTRELPPSAATTMSAVASVPSAKNSRTRPSGSRS